MPRRGGGRRGVRRSRVSHFHRQNHHHHFHHRTHHRGYFGGYYGNRINRTVFRRPTCLKNPFYVNTPRRRPVSTVSGTAPPLEATDDTQRRLEPAAIRGCVMIGVGFIFCIAGSAFLAVDDFLFGGFFPGGMLIIMGMLPMSLGFIMCCCCKTVYPGDEDDASSTAGEDVESHYSSTASVVSETGVAGGGQLGWPHSQGAMAGVPMATAVTSNNNYTANYTMWNTPPGGTSQFGMYGNNLSSSNGAGGEMPFNTTHPGLPGQMVVNTQPHDPPPDYATVMNQRNGAPGHAV